MQTKNIHYWAHKLANNKNPQFFVSNQADIQAIFSTHKLGFYTKFHKDWVKNFQ